MQRPATILALIFALQLSSCAEVTDYELSPSSPGALALIENGGSGFASVEFHLTRMDGMGVGTIGTPALFTKPQPHIAWMGELQPGRYAIALVVLPAGQPTRVYLCNATFEFDAKPGEVAYLGRMIVSANGITRLEDNFDQAKLDIASLPKITAPVSRAVTTPTKLPRKQGLLGPGGC